MSDSHECDLVRDVQPAVRLISRSGFQSLSCLVCGQLHTYVMKKILDIPSVTRWEFNLVAEPEGAKIREQKLDQTLSPNINNNDGSGPKTQRTVVDE